MITLKLTPASRLGLAIQKEIGLSPDVLYTESIYQKYLSKRIEADDRKNHQLRALFILDAVLAVLLLGKSITVPFLDIQLVDIPAAVEIVTAFSSATFILLAIALANELGYDTIIRTFNARRGGFGLLDSDFFTLSDVYSELSLKMYRAKFNDHGVDAHQSGRTFERLCWMVWVIFILLAVSILLLHLGLLTWSVSLTLKTHGISLLTIIYLFFILFSTFAAIAIYSALFVRFEFKCLTDDQLRERRWAESYAPPSASFVEMVRDSQKDTNTTG